MSGKEDDKIIRYIHHNTEKPVYVKAELKGKHRNYCLCNTCNDFHPDDRKLNCNIANILYFLCVEFDIVTPVWECPAYKPKVNKQGAAPQLRPFPRHPYMPTPKHGGG